MHNAGLKYLFLRILNVANAKNLAIGDPIVGIRSDAEFVPKTMRI